MGTLTEAVEVTEVAQPEAGVRSTEVSNTTTHMAIAPTRVESTKHLLMATKKQIDFRT